MIIMMIVALVILLTPILSSEMCFTGARNEHVCLDYILLIEKNTEQPSEVLNRGHSYSTGIAIEHT